MIEDVMLSLDLLYIFGQEKLLFSKAEVKLLQIIHEENKHFSED